MKGMIDGRLARTTAILFGSKEVVKFGMFHGGAAKCFIVEVEAGFCQTDGSLIIHEVGLLFLLDECSGA